MRTLNDKGSAVEIENRTAGLSRHVAQGWMVPPTSGMEKDMNRAAELAAYIVQADMFRFVADKEILEEKGKICGAGGPTCSCP